MKDKNMLKKWFPIPNLPKDLYIDAIYDNIEGFRVLLRSLGTGNTLRVSFSAILAYKNMDESFLLKVWSSVDEKSLGNIFYIWEKSLFIEYFHEMSLNVYENWDIKHYSIYTETDCIDVLSVKPPELTWLNSVDD